MKVVKTSLIRPQGHPNRVILFEMEEENMAVALEDNNKMMYTNCGRIIPEVEKGAFKTIDIRRMPPYTVLATTVEGEWENVTETCEESSEEDSEESQESLEEKGDE